MEIKQDPVTKLWCREDGAVLMPPDGHKFTKFRWTFGSLDRHGYRQVCYKGKRCQVHRIVCRAFHGLPPADKPFCDHKSRIKSANFASNLHWVSPKGNADNQDRVDKSVEKYGVRGCDDKKAYLKAYSKTHYGMHREEHKAYDAAKAAKMKAQGLVYRKGPDGKHHWLPRVRTTNQDKGAGT